MDRVPFGAFVSEGSNGNCFRGRARSSTDLGRKSQPDTLHLPNRRRQVWRQFLRFLVEISLVQATGDTEETTFTGHLESSAAHVNSLREIKARVGESKDVSSIYLFIYFFIGESPLRKEKIKKNNDNKVR